MPNLFQNLSSTTLKGIDEADKNYFEILRENPPPSQTLIKHIEIQQGFLEAEREKVNNNKRLESQERCTITPPTEADYSRAKEISKTLEQMTATSERCGAVMDLTTELLNIWNKTDPQPA